MAVAVGSIDGDSLVGKHEEKVFYQVPGSSRPPQRDTAQQPLHTDDGSTAGLARG